MVVNAVMKDSISYSHGNLDGVAFCGARAYSITMPSPSPAWLTIDLSTGAVSLKTSDNTLGGSTQSVEVTIALVDYPMITEKISFSVVFKSCTSAIITPPLLSQILDDTYLSTTTKHSQSYASILTGTTNDIGLSCGAFGINWYQTTSSNPTPVLADSSVFSQDNILSELNVLTSDATKVNVYTILYEVYMLEYPTVKSSMQTAYI